MNTQVVPIFFACDDNFVKYTLVSLTSIMENASKALIIAGAILLSILIIGLGMLIFNNAKEQIAGANLDQEAIAATNSKFEAYEGTNIDVSRVKSLARKVLTYNNRNENKKITIKRKDDTKGISSSIKINEWIDTLNQHSNWEYKISITDYYNDGTIKKINATLTSGSGNEGAEDS